MSRSLHEELGREHHVEGGSDRGFGLTVGGILLAIAAWRAFAHGGGLVPWALAPIGGGLLLFGLVAPRRLAPLNRAWTKLGLLLSRIVSPLAIGLIYGLTIVPTGLVMRALGRDLLRLHFDAGVQSYWILREQPGPAADTMTRQF